MKNFKIKSYCKINLFLRVIKKLNNGYHNIMSLITFCDLHDVISISKIRNLKDKISFSGKFKGGINNKSDAVIAFGGALVGSHSPFGMQNTLVGVRN